MHSEFFGATRAQARAVVILFAIFLVVVFSPALQIVRTIFRTNPVHNAQIQVVIPRTWLLRHNFSAIEAWVPCMTVFCSSPRASMSIKMIPKLAGERDAWQAGTNSVFQQSNFTV